MCTRTDLKGGSTIRRTPTTSVNEKDMDRISEPIVSSSHLQISYLLHYLLVYLQTVQHEILI